MELSSTSINVASVTVIATIHGFILGRHGAATAGALTSGAISIVVAAAI
jgi:hypothetical protein